MFPDFKGFFSESINHLKKGEIFEFLVFIFLFVIALYSAFLILCFICFIWFFGAIFNIINYVVRFFSTDVSLDKNQNFRSLNKDNNTITKNASKDIKILPKDWDLNDSVVGVYRITNTINKKVYIGESVHIKKRWEKHFNDLVNKNHHNKNLQIDFSNQLGKGFNPEVLIRVFFTTYEETKKKLLTLEKEQIEKHKQMGLVVYNMEGEDFKQNESEKIKYEDFAEHIKRNNEEYQNSLESLLELNKEKSNIIDKIESDKKRVANNNENLSNKKEFDLLQKIKILELALEQDVEISFDYFKNGELGKTRRIGKIIKFEESKSNNMIYFSQTSGDSNSGLMNQGKFFIIKNIENICLYKKDKDFFDIFSIDSDKYSWNENEIWYLLKRTDLNKTDEEGFNPLMFVFFYNITYKLNFNKEQLDYLIKNSNTKHEDNEGCNSLKFSFFYNNQQNLNLTVEQFDYLIENSNLGGYDLLYYFEYANNENLNVSDEGLRRLIEETDLDENYWEDLPDGRMGNLGNYLIIGLNSNKVKKINISEENWLYLIQNSYLGYNHYKNGNALLIALEHSKTELNFNSKCWEYLIENSELQYEEKHALIIAVERNVDFLSYSNWYKLIKKSNQFFKEKYSVSPLLYFLENNFNLTKQTLSNLISSSDLEFTHKNRDALMIIIEKNISIYEEDWKLLIKNSVFYKKDNCILIKKLLRYKIKLSDSNWMILIRKIKDPDEDLQQIVFSLNKDNNIMSNKVWIALRGACL